MHINALYVHPFSTAISIFSKQLGTPLKRKVWIEDTPRSKWLISRWLLSSQWLIAFLSRRGALGLIALGLPLGFLDAKDGKHEDMMGIWWVYCLLTVQWRCLTIVSEMGWNGDFHGDFMRIAWDRQPTSTNNIMDKHREPTGNTCKFRVKLGTAESASKDSTRLDTNMVTGYRMLPYPTVPIMQRHMIYESMILSFMVWKTYW